MENSLVWHMWAFAGFLVLLGVVMLRYLTSSNHWNEDVKKYPKVFVNGNSWRKPMHILKEYENHFTLEDPEDPTHKQLVFYKYDTENLDG